MRFAILAAAALLFTACGNAAETAAPSPRGGRLYGDAARGKTYAERWCTTCHTIGARGSDSAPALELLKKNPEKTAAYVRGFLAAPHKPMPPLSLSTQEIEDIVAFLLTP